MDCVFCAIAAGDEDADVFSETAESVALAPLEPVSPGHLLVVPRDHYESLFDIPADTLAAVTEHARTLARRLEDGGYDGVNVLHASGAVAGQSVGHFHLHLAPRREGDGLDLWPDSGYDGDGDYDRLAAVLGADA